MLVQTVVTAACIFLFFRPGQFLGSDLIAYGAGGLVAMLVTWKYIHGKIPEIVFSKQMAKEMSDLVLGTRWVLLTALLSMIYTSLEMPLISLWRSASDAGTYRTAVTLSESIYTFMTFLNAILYPYLVVWNRRGPRVLWRMQRRVLIFFMMLGGVVIALTFIFASFLYEILYHGAYQDAIQPFRLLVVAKVFLLLAGIYSWGFMARKQDKTLLAILAPLSVGALVTASLTIPRFGIGASASVAMTFSFLFFILTFLTSGFQLRRSEKTR